MKYITFSVEINDTKIIVPFIFSSMLVHRDMTDNCRVIKRTFPTAKVTLRSAGMVNSSLECSGESETLNISSHPDDTRILQSYDYCHGIEA